MLDIKFICENPEIVKENIKRKFKDHKLPLVDELIALYTEKKDITPTITIATPIIHNRLSFDDVAAADCFDLLFVVCFLTCCAIY